MNANINCCLTEANGLSNMLFYLEKCLSGLSFSVVLSVANQSGNDNNLSDSLGIQLAVRNTAAPQLSVPHPS